MKALKNFSCNGLRKKSGESISEEELKVIGDFKDQLLNDDFIGGSEKKSKEKSEKKSEKKSKEKSEKKVSKLF